MSILSLALRLPVNGGPIAMKQLIFALAILSKTMLGSAYAETPTPIFSGKDIVEYCLAGDLEEVALYAAGIIDFHVFLRSAGWEKLICPPREAEAGKLGLAVCKYSRTSPELVAEGGSALLVLTAAQDVFPCKRGRP